MSLKQSLENFVNQFGLHDHNGVVKTYVPGVYIYHSCQGCERSPFHYNSGIIALAQGAKNIYYGGNQYRYDENQFLVLGVPLPLECEAIVEDGKPALGVAIDIKTSSIAEQISHFDQIKLTELTQQPMSSIGAVKYTESSENAFSRLVESLCDPVEAKLLGPSIVNEIIYRTLTSDQGNVLFELTQQNSNYAKIAQALKVVHSEFAQELRVDHLAKQAGMSVSLFHKVFKETTSSTPIQYIKHVRLHRAKELIIGQKRRVSEAAELVGYTSTSQFSREYKRLFNVTPKSANGIQN